MNIGRILPALLSVILLVSSGCADYDAEFKRVDDRIDEIENNRIPSIDKQLEKINASLPELERTDQEIKKMIESLDKTADGLRKDIGENENRVSEVRSELEKAVKELQDSDKTNKMELIAAINDAKGVVLANLEAMRSEMQGKLSDVDEMISDLKDKDQELEKQISDLRTYVDDELKGIKDWATATFATLEQYNAVVERIGGINTEMSELKKSLSDLEARLTKKFNEDLKKAVSDLESKIGEEVAGLNDRIDEEISDLTEAYTSAIAKTRAELENAWTENVKTSLEELEKSLKLWVNGKLTAYWTIEETKAAIESQKKDLENQLKAQEAYLKELISANAGEIKDLKKALAETENALADNAKSLDDLFAELEQTKKDIKAAYEAAIKDAITSLKGDMDKELADRIDSLNNSIDERVEALESRIQKCKDDLDSIIEAVEDAREKIRNVITSFVYFPTYSDGSVEVFCEGVKKSLTLKFEVRPFSAAEALNVNNVSILTQSVEPKDYVLHLKLNGITNTGNGIVLMDIDASVLPVVFTNVARKFNVLVSIKDASKGWDMISEFIPITPVVVTNP